MSCCCHVYVLSPNLWSSAVCPGVALLFRDMPLLPLLTSQPRLSPSRASQLALWCCTKPINNWCWPATPSCCGANFRRRLQRGAAKGYVNVDKAKLKATLHWPYTLPSCFPKSKQTDSHFSAFAVQAESFGE